MDTVDSIKGKKLQSMWYRYGYYQVNIFLICTLGDDVFELSASLMQSPFIVDKYPGSLRMS